MEREELILVSSCLIGVECRYDANTVLDERVTKIFKKGYAVALCPELLGGLPCPRACCEIAMSQGEKTSRVISSEGKDFTNEFMIGAQKVLEVCQSLGIKKAVLKENSPSCGSSKVYDGTFTGNKISGEGITARMLRNNGIKVYCEDDLWE